MGIEPQPPQVIVISPPVQYQRTSPFCQRRRGPFGRHIDLCGIRSFIFQVLLGCWTSFVGGICLLMSVAAADGIDSGQYSESQMVSSLGTGLVCFGVTWAIVAFPLVIGAVATFGPSRR